MSDQATTRCDYRTRRVGAYLLDIEIKRGWDGLADDVKLVLRDVEPMIFGHVASFSLRNRGRKVIMAAFQDLRERIAQRVARDYAGV